LDERDFGLYTNDNRIMALNYCPHCGAEIIIFQRTNTQRLRELEQRIKQLENNIGFEPFNFDNKFN